MNLVTKMSATHVASGIGTLNVGSVGGDDELQNFVDDDLCHDF